MFQRVIARDLSWLAFPDSNRRLFDALIPLPRGTSYNAYVIQGTEGTALIDTVEPCFSEDYLAALERLQPREVRWIISNHAEQDHSGTLPLVLARFPESKLLCTPKAKSILLDHLRLPEDRIQPVQDGELISLGDRTLEFLHTPWVHWPETMLTWLQEDQILFPCDLFGSHVANNALYASEAPGTLEQAGRYFATIMAPFTPNIRKYLRRLESYPATMIAPSHGPLWDQPGQILEAYRRWTSESLQNRVVIAFVSMHESTRLLCEELSQDLESRGVEVELHDLVEMDLGRFAYALIGAKTLILGSPTVLGGAHPQAIYVAAIVNALRPGIRQLGIVGSYGWGGRMVEQITGILSGLKIEMLPPLLLRGLHGEQERPRVAELADRITAGHETSQ